MQPNPELLKLARRFYGISKHRLGHRGQQAAALSRRRAKNRVAKQSRKVNR